MRVEVNKGWIFNEIKKGMKTTKIIKFKKNQFLGSNQSNF